MGLADPRGDPGWAIPPSERGHHRRFEQRTGTADLHLKGCFGRCVKNTQGLGVGGGRGQQREQTGERSQDSASSRPRGTQGVQGAWCQPTDLRGWVLYTAGCTPLPTRCQQHPRPLGRHQPLFPGVGGGEQNGQLKVDRSDHGGGAPRACSWTVWGCERDSGEQQSSGLDTPAPGGLRTACPPAPELVQTAQEALHLPPCSLAVNKDARTQC